jgi:hypothetical protein
MRPALHDLPLGEALLARLEPKPLLRGAPTPGGDLQPAGRLGGVLLVVFAPEHGCVLAVTPDTTLRVYSYPDFRLRAVSPLTQTIYQAALDTRRGLLYAAVCPPAALVLGPLGNRERAHGDLQVFDVRPLLALARNASAAPVQGPRLSPRRTLPLAAHVRNLWLSADGRWLHYLANERRSTHIGRVRTADLVLAGSLPLRFSGGSLVRSVDGRMLYGTALDHLFILDPETLRIRRSVAYPGGTTGLVADDQQRIYLVETGRVTTVTVLDMRQGRITGNWTVPLKGRIHLALAPDGQRLYMSSSAVTGNRIYSLLVSGERAKQPLLLGQAGSDRLGVVRGKNFLSPDGKFLINRAGKVFRLSPTPDSLQ